MGVCVDLFKEYEDKEKVVYRFSLVKMKKQQEKFNLIN
ncbi:hypothetical protein ACVWY7_003678 [Bacillus sp. TE9106W]|nr:hypothetical protein TUN_26710 [Bacillus sp. M21]